MKSVNCCTSPTLRVPLKVLWRRALPTGSSIGLAALILQSALPVQAAWRAPVRARHGMVASTNRIASQVGVDILKRGGNAVDAAVAVAFALAVTYPAAGNLGGGGFMMIRRADGQAVAIDYREIAPAKASRTMYIGADGKLIEGEGSSTVGYRAAGVPGTVAGMDLALRKYGSGKLKWADVIEPARKLARNGFTVSHGLQRSLRNNRDLLGRYSESRRIFLRNGKLWKEGEILRQSELAATLARLQKNGPREFYQGQTARLIADDMKAHNGLMSLDDLKNYRAKERVPVRGTYRGHTVLSMPPPSSGGVALIEMLNILEGYDMKVLHPFSAARYHRMLEAMRRAFADRAEWMADPDFVKVPTSGLIQKSYAARWREGISLEQAARSADIKAGTPVGAEAMQTTHFSLVDAAGNAVSNTYTLNGGFGSGVTARGTGVLFNNEMDDFTSQPGTPNRYGLIQSERNAVAPRKRPLSAMTPTFVLRSDGKLWFAVGSPGGPTIINTLLQIITNVVDYDMDLQAAIDAPRVHHQWLPDEIAHEPLGLSKETQSTLIAMGHTFAKTARVIGDAHGVMIDPATGMRLGAADARNEGAAVGY
ncbi:MAG: gamma-glutamyltranspeptidase / glutathione hydrolase [Abditibacteriota bacterium]|nr:gamma-glutamyltranspeptidase / glutathione hydrolase [Abditibacteriota bacterium]